MNSPIEKAWTDREIFNTYLTVQDKKEISRIFQIPVKTVNQIVKKYTEVKYYG